MARDKKTPNPNEPKKHLLPAMSVRRPPPSVPKYLVCLIWNDRLGRNDIRVRPNPDYSE
jgi:hypothetical protein